ncbi:MAG: response regulator [Patescibacteria group bacterium]
MKKILIVDDEPLVIKAISDKLNRENYTIDSALDGEEALLKVGREKPDLILLDIVMPKLDGISVLKKLKGQEETKDIPVIILTNLYDDKKIEELLKVNNTEYLIKVEHSLNDIVKRVNEKLNYNEPVQL